jgi:hypothetical protein
MERDHYEEPVVDGKIILPRIGGFVTNNKGFWTG